MNELLQIIESGGSLFDEKEGYRQIPYVDLSVRSKDEKEELLSCISRVLDSGQYVGISCCEEFESAIAAYCGVPRALAVSSGTDALCLALRVLSIGPGDEVITVPNSHFASVASIVQAGAKPVFVDVGPDQNIDIKLIEPAITKNTKAIMPVHLTGRVCDMPSIMEIAEAYELLVVEDAAQAVGATFNNRMAGTFGDAGAFSAHPLKNLNAIGDAGYLFVRDIENFERASRLRNHGLEDRDTVLEWGNVSRMDAIQSEVLTLRLKNLDEVISRRRRNARFYNENIKSRTIQLPRFDDLKQCTFHTYVIQAEERDLLAQRLHERGIGTAIHYPVPLHLQPSAIGCGYSRGDFPVAEALADKILSIPIHQCLELQDLEYIAHHIDELSGY